MAILIIDFCYCKCHIDFSALYMNLKFVSRLLVALLFLGVFAMFSVSDAYAVTFTRKVMVQNVTVSSVDFRWITDTKEALVVKYGTTTSYGSQVNSDTVTGTGGANNHARITGLSANQKYFYQVVTTGGVAVTPAGDTNYFFRTAPPTGSTTPFSFAIWGDSGTGSSTQQAVANQVNLKQPHLAMVAGDIVYDYTQTEGTNNTKHFNIYANTMRYSPFYSTCGNHEQINAACPTVIADQTLPQNGNASGVLSTFSWDYGNVHFVSLNTNQSFAYNPTNPAASDPQVKWAYDDLRATSQPWKVLLWHHNGWSAGTHSTNSSINTHLMKLAQDTGAQLAIWGHSHVYERWPRVAPYQNVQAYTIGNGGQKSTTSCTSLSPACLAKNNGEAGFLLGEVNGNTMTMRYITETGTNPDSITLTTTGGGTPVTPVPTPVVTASPTVRPTATPTLRPSTTPGSSATPPTATIVGTLTGDANGDGRVDGQDYARWLANYNLTTSNGPQDGDFNRSGKVDGIDYVLWLTNFGRTPAPSPIAGNTNPPTGTTTPSDPNFQPAAPYYATFFYPWYENPNTDGRWSQWSDFHTPPQNWFSEYLPDPNPSAFDPANELYSSSNDAILYWQLRKLKEAKQEVAIASWWGQTHKTNRAFGKIITDVMNRADNPYPNLRWAAYYEKEGFGNPPLSELVADLNYIKNNYATQKGYLKINGKPVIFVYNAAHTGFSPSEDLSRWQQAREQTGFYVVMKRDPLTSSNAGTMDGWHEYAPAVRKGGTAPYWYFVSPGFWLNGTTERLTRDAAAFETAVRDMINSNATWKLTETWNEWGEGSGVEPADQVNQVPSGSATLKSGGYPFKNLYIDILNRNLPSLEGGGGTTSGGASPNPTNPPISATSVPTGSGTTAVIAAAGDIACGTGSSGAACKQMETSNLLVQMNPAAVLALGDIQYEEATLTDFNNFYNPSWGRMKSVTYPAVGNHEYLTTNASGYFDYYNGVGNQTGRAGDRSKGYYAFDVGAWRLYSLNSNCSRAGGCGPGSPQETWLRQDLAANPKSCVLAFWHHPLWTSGSRINEGGGKEYLMKALYDYNAELALVGHEHNYERFAPQRPEGASGVLDNARGVRQFVVGTGGRNFTSFTHTEVNSEVRNANTFGVLKLTLKPASYDFQFVPIAGSSFTDVGSVNCH
jgi:acid phosphatase type 7